VAYSQILLFNVCEASIPLTLPLQVIFEYGKRPTNFTSAFIEDQAPLPITSVGLILPSSLSITAFGSKLSR